MAGVASALLDTVNAFRYPAPMVHFLADHGYPVLFLLSFLASTLIPLGSEWLVVAMLLNRHEPLQVVSVATVGNYLGACTSFLIGIYGGPFLIRKILRISDEDQVRAKRFYSRYGSLSLLFSWLPVIGDPLCLLGGVLRISFPRFSLLVFSGKLARYAVVAYLTLKAMDIAAP